MLVALASDNKRRLFLAYIVTKEIGECINLASILTKRRMVEKIFKEIDV
jgi:hypothetical protein